MHPRRMNFIIHHSFSLTIGRYPIITLIAWKIEFYWGTPKSRIEPAHQTTVGEWPWETPPVINKILSTLSALFVVEDAVIWRPSIAISITINSFVKPGPLLCAVFIQKAKQIYNIITATILLVTKRETTAHHHSFHQIWISQLLLTTQQLWFLLLWWRRTKLERDSVVSDDFQTTLCFFPWNKPPVLLRNHKQFV